MINPIKILLHLFHLKYPSMVNTFNKFCAYQIIDSGGVCVRENVHGINIQYFLNNA